MATGDWRWGKVKVYKGDWDGWWWYTLLRPFQDGGWRCLCSTPESSMLWNRTLLGPLVEFSLVAAFHTMTSTIIFPSHDLSTFDWYDHSVRAYEVKVRQHNEWLFLPLNSFIDRNSKYNALRPLVCCLLTSTLFRPSGKCSRADLSFESRRSRITNRKQQTPISVQPAL